MELLLLPIILWILFAMFVADLGKNRNIGYTSALLIALILSPLIGFLIVLLSPQKIKVETINTPVAVTEPSGKLKSCPDCAEDVREAARKCKHCGYRWDA